MGFAKLVGENQWDEVRKTDSHSWLGHLLSQKSQEFFGLFGSPIFKSDVKQRFPKSFLVLNSL